MNDELPEPLNRVSPLAAPRELRVRTLAAVNRELSVRRKPRWERALERTAAALLVLGVGLNVWQAWQPGVVAVTRDLSQPPAVARKQSLGDRELDQALKSRMAIRPASSRGTEEYGAAYRRLLAEISTQPAG